MTQYADVFKQSSCFRRIHKGRRRISYSYQVVDLTSWQIVKLSPCKGCDRLVAGFATFPAYRLASRPAEFSSLLVVCRSNHLFFIPILGGIAAVLQASVLWIVSKKRRTSFDAQTLFWIIFAVSCALVVPLVFVTPVRLPFMAIVLLLCHHPTFSSSFLVLGSIALCFVLLYTIAAIWMRESMEGIPNASMAVFLLFLVLLVLRRSFFTMARDVWQVCVCARISRFPAAYDKQFCLSCSAHRLGLYM